MKNKFSIIIGAIVTLMLTQSCQETTTVTEQTLFEKKAAIDPPVTYSGKNLIGIDFKYKELL